MNTEKRARRTGCMDPDDVPHPPCYPELTQNEKTYCLAVVEKYTSHSGGDRSENGALHKLAMDLYRMGKGTHIPLPEFIASGTYVIPGRGRVYSVALDSQCEGFSWLINQKVRVDIQGTIKFFTVLGVEAFAHAAPFRVGEPVGLLVTRDET